MQYRTYRGLDAVRGTGIFFVVLMHTAFYHFDGIWELDLAAPPLIVTVIGFLLMFAGLFAMTSGFAHTLRYAARARDGGERIGRFLASRFVSGAFILAVAYAYFIVTGPGIVHFESRIMDESILVGFINTGRLACVSAERLLYVDSLVMIGTNTILLGVFLSIAHAVSRSKQVRPVVAFIAALAVFLISLARIPLYHVYTTAVANGDLPVTIALNWLVNKNNPVLPYAAFSLFGAWTALSFSRHQDRAWKRIVWIASAFLVTGVSLYVLLPDTMLERSIDLKWYAIMTFQVGLFLMLLTGAVMVLDYRKSTRPPSPLARFFLRFGTAGLTVFFFESVVSALVFRVVRAIVPGFRLGLDGALAAGAVFALGWGFALALWEKSGYRFGIERLYCSVMRLVGGSAKTEKLEHGPRR